MRLWHLHVAEKVSPCTLQLLIMEAVTPQKHCVRVIRCVWEWCRTASVNSIFSITPGISAKAIFDLIVKSKSILSMTSGSNADITADQWQQYACPVQYNWYNCRPSTRYCVKERFDSGNQSKQNPVALWESGGNPPLFFTHYRSLHSIDDKRRETT